MFIKPRILSQFSGENPYKRLISTLLEITFLQGYCSVNIVAERYFIENTSRELLLYIVLNKEIINLEVLSKQVKIYFKHNYFKHLLNFVRDFRLVSFQKP